MEQNMNMEGQQTMPSQEERKPLGITISIIIVVLVIALGGYYFLKKVPQQAKEVQILTPQEVQADPTVSQLSTQGTSININDIQQDVNATDFSGLSNQLDNISL